MATDIKKTLIDNLVKAVNQAITASPQQRGQAFMDNIHMMAQNPERMSFGGDMVGVNPGGFAGALRSSYSPEGNLMSVKPPASATPPSAINQASGSRTASLGQIQQATQDPDLTLYENALNRGDTGILDKLMRYHSGDARFSVHLSIPGLGSPPGAGVIK